MHAGARVGSAKGVPPEVWASVLGELSGTIVLTCGPGEEANARAVRDAVPGCVLLDDPPLDVAELLAVHEWADVVLTSDSGPRHLAQAAGARVVVLCGPTDPRHTADGAQGVRVLRVEVPCGPCHRETCEIEGEAHHACMRRIDARDVRDAAFRLLPMAENG